MDEQMESYDTLSRELEQAKRVEAELRQVKQKAAPLSLGFHIFRVGRRINRCEGRSTR